MALGGSCDYFFIIFFSFITSSALLKPGGQDPPAPEQDFLGETGVFLGWGGVSPGEPLLPRVRPPSAALFTVDLWLNYTTYSNSHRIASNFTDLPSRHHFLKVSPVLRGSTSSLLVTKRSMQISPGSGRGAGCLASLLHLRSLLLHVRFEKPLLSSLPGRRCRRGHE